MHGLATRLWPLNRSITGDGVRETLAILQEHLPALTINEVPSGTGVFDWQVPDEWTIRSAVLTGPNGEVVADFAQNNLHVVGYSVPVDGEFTLDEIQPHLHSIVDQPTAIPYVTSYYNRTWGFCLADDVRRQLPPGTYRAHIDSDIAPGSLTYGELIIPGDSTDEVFISTYICHPSMANNELSGPVVTTALALHLMSLPNRHYTYRIAFVPETIGAITYAALHLSDLQRNVVAAFNLSCIGDDRAYTYLASRLGNLRIDRIAKRVLRDRPNVVEYSYLARGSDERHYGAPGVDLPIISLMRSRYADYPEYHTSLDDLVNVVTPTGLQGGFDIVRECLDVLENEPVLVATQLGEPQLGRRGLYHQIMGKTVANEIMLRTDILAYADGQHGISDMVELFNVPADTLRVLIDELKAHDLVREVHQSNHIRAGAAG
jgi:aminopeptidase-like protein